MVALIAACSSKHPPADAPPLPPPPPVAPAAAPADAGSGAGKITLTVKPAKRPGEVSRALGKRCTLGGDPLVASCIGGSEGLALDKAGTLHVVSGTEVRRYTRTGDCAYEPAGAPIALPGVPVRGQSLNGPVYMRSGGPAWHLLGTADAIYAYDYLAGASKLDHDAFVPACADVFGYDTMVALGGKLLVRRNGIEQLAPGKKCTARSAKVDDKARGKLFAIAGKLIVADGDKVTRYDPAPTAIAEGTHLCSIWTAVACGDGACLVDGNCKTVVQTDAAGKTVRTLDFDRLFDPTPWSVPAAIQRPDGTVVAFATHRDHEVCEGALYELPAAVFAR